MSSQPQHVLRVIREQIAKGVAASKCHRCGCLQQTVEALARTEAGETTLRPALADASKVFVEKEYDCLGCPVCFPAISVNAFAGAFPEESERLDLCPTEEPKARTGWPPLPGDYHVVRACRHPVGQIPGRGLRVHQARLQNISTTGVDSKGLEGTPGDSIQGRRQRLVRPLERKSCAISQL